MSDLIVTVQRNGHANLDSFPFRYGFSQSKDFHLLLNFNSGISTTYDKRKRIDNAQFKNPSTGEINNGNFLSRLYERIKVDHLIAPSLSERVPDILPIINYYISKFNSIKFIII